MKVSAHRSLPGALVMVGAAALVGCDREIVCALNREDKGEATGSAEGAAE
ncbi:MAG: hypothetical protein ACR2GO_03510 [Candidatus Limnocylindria bacterium]